MDKAGKPYTYRKTVTKRTVAHMPGDWRAAAEYLARRDPDNWARTAPQKLEHTGANGGAIEHAHTIRNLPALPEDTLGEILNADNED